MTTPKTARQRRMWVLPAPKGGLDKSDRYEIGIFYAIRFVVSAITLPLRVMFTSAFQPDVFVSEDQGVFVSIRKGTAGGDSEKKLQVFKSLWEKNIFTSLRKQRKDN